MATPLHIRDLAKPQLTPMQRQAIAYAETVSFDFSSEGVLEAARRRTGLRDFGPNDFRERLMVWLQSINEDKGLGPLGRLSLYNDCVRLASNRLRVEDLVRRHPEILGTPIEKPLLIAGLPRSGTTNLVNLVAADKRLRSMPLWESMEPVPVSIDAPGLDGEDPRRLRSREAWGQFEELLPLMPAMHEMAPDHIHEDVELMQIDFSSYVLEWLCRAKTWQQWYLASDRSSSYRYGRKVHQVLSWLKGLNRWVIKSPQHMENLPVLIQTYPDATIVVTHRDPVAVIQSIVTMLAYGDRIRRSHIDLPELARYWVDRIELLLRACVRDRDVIPAKKSLDVLFHEYMADTEGTLRRIYATADLELTAEARAQIAAYQVANPRAKHGQIKYGLESDFGVRIGELRERFDFYYRRFPVHREPAPGDRI